MGLGVFIRRSDSRYDDTPAERYQFPGNYLTRVQACIQNWIVYLEPSKVPNTRGYFAIAKVEKVVPDPTTENMYLALIEQGSYLDFINPVPFNDGSNIAERGLLNEKGRMSGRAQSAVRSISSEDFDRILELGFDERQSELPRIGEIEVDQPSFAVAEDQSPFAFEQPRVRVNQITSRVVRDRLFRRLVLKAYDKRCAITGLQLINGGGRAEVDAAHIKPVEANGPDILSNGIALSGTAHWMFDRGLIGLTDDHEIMISRHVNDPDSVESLINKSRKAIVPGLPVNQPHPSFLKWHRENCFKI